MTDIITVVQRTVEVVQMSHSGVQGEQGVQGIQGVAGANGADGADGQDSAPYWAHAYTISLTPGPPSQSGRVSLDAYPGEVATKMYLGYDPGGNVGSMFRLLMAIPVGSMVLLQDKTDELKWGKFLVTGPVVALQASRNVEIPISFIAKSSTAIAGQAALVFALPVS